MFQSSPNLSARCSACAVKLRVTTRWFQSSPNREVGCSLIFPRIMKVGCFNPHPTSGLAQVAVSTILVCFNPRPTSRLGAGGGSHNPAVFQSSPNLSAGCSVLSHPCLVCRCFNPHPAERLGASAEGVVTIGDPVSILIQPRGWVQHQFERGVASYTPVSFQSSSNLFGWA